MSGLLKHSTLDGILLGFLKYNSRAITSTVTVTVAAQTGGGDGGGGGDEEEEGGGIIFFGEEGGNPEQVGDEFPRKVESLIGEKSNFSSECQDSPNFVLCNQFASLQHDLAMLDFDGPQTQILSSVPHSQMPFQQHRLKPSKHNWVLNSEHTAPDLSDAIILMSQEEHQTEEQKMGDKKILEEWIKATEAN